MASYRVVIICEGVPHHYGASGADCIADNFAKRIWQKNAICRWDGLVLTLTVENDFDRKGSATMDEFSDAISACIPGGFNGDLRLVSVTEINPHPTLR